MKNIFHSTDCLVVSASNTRADDAGAGHLHMHMLLTVALLMCLQEYTSAMFGRRCRKVAAAHVRRKYDPSQCSKYMCGNVPKTEVIFEERLSPQCSALMDEYKSTWSLNGLSNLMDTRPCTSSRWAIRPTGPILVSNKEPIATFAMCTMPKVACTNFRKLLSLLIRYPEAMPTDSFEQFQNPHTWAYPNVWHYNIPEPATASNETARGDASGSSATACPRSAPDNARASSHTIVWCWEEPLHKGTLLWDYSLGFFCFLEPCVRLILPCRD